MAQRAQNTLLVLLLLLERLRVLLLLRELLSLLRLILLLWVPRLLLQLWVPLLVLLSKFRRGLRQVDKKGTKRGTTGARHKHATESNDSGLSARSK